MKNQSKTIVFFGTDEFSLTTLSSLVENNYKIAAVITKPDSKSGRGQKINMTPVKKYALEHSIDVWQPVKVAEVNDRIAALGSDIIGILVVYGKIIPKSTIDLFKDGIINIHPSLLPKYRGPSPIESAILNGDHKTGITIMKIDEGMDSGPICSQLVYDLNGSEDRPNLYNIFAKLGSEMLIKILPSLNDGTLVFTQQSNSEARYCKLLIKQDGYIDTTKSTAVIAERMIRAYLSYPKTKTVVKNYNIILTKAHVSDIVKSPLDIKFTDNSILSIDELIAPSGKKMSAKSFINGYKLD